MSDLHVFQSDEAFVATDQEATVTYRVDPESIEFPPEPDAANACPRGPDRDDAYLGRRIERWLISDLKAHPHQQTLFTDLDEQAFRDLVSDMRINGQLQPVEALPDGTLICGHQRLRAAIELHWQELDVWVRDDLAKIGDAAIEQRLITDNLHRRHLDKLDLGRCYLRLRELERRLPDKKRHAYSQGKDLRDVIAKRIGGSGRNLDRYLRVLQAPMEVQQAFSAGKISLIDAGKIAGLSTKAQNAIAAEIRAGRDVKEVVRERLTKPEQPKEPEPALQPYEVLEKEAEKLEFGLRVFASDAKNAGELSATAKQFLERAKATLDQVLAMPDGVLA